jgi:hypothetical protein
MADILNTEPPSVNAGDTVRWTRRLTDYPAGAGWVLGYTLLNATAKITLTGTASGDDHAIVVAAATTAAWVAGDYAWRARVSRGAEVFTVGEGRMQVRPSFGATTLDTRSTARRALEAVEAYLADPNNLSAASYEIADRSLSRYDLPALWAHRDRLRVEVAREDAAARIAAGLPGGSGRVYVRFGP